ncbi:unnamed protein product [Adineta steineri]|uniref:Eukaryotic translation initiation factor 3 subunit C n=1 Tax=Adineta steineri TaxID=433720 RepID=A0A813UY42_9BILA|nr:unnamed protein product [Adineta steineri]CAF3922068.1 unnamed protein product [Adineta steineri]
MASNRFFLSDDSSSSEDTTDDEQQQQVQAPKKGASKGATKSAAKPYLTVSDDEEDVKRVVRSEKVKRYEEIEEIIKKMKHAMRIRDIGLVYECYENLIKAYEKARRVLEKDQGLPRSFIKILAQLDDFINQCWGDREWRDALNKNNSNNLSALRQKIRRFLKQEPLEKEINAYREKPDVHDEELPEHEASPVAQSAESEDDEEEAAAPAKGKPQQDDDESDSSDVTWDESEDDSTDSSIDVDAPNEELYKKFLKTDKTEKEKKNKDASGTKRAPKARRPDRPVQQSEDEDEDGPKDGAPRQDVQKLVSFGKDEEITHDAILKKLNDIIAMRGKRGTNRRDQLECLKILRLYVEKQNLGVGLDIKILLIQIAVSFDYHHKGNECLKPDTWTRVLDYIDELLTLLTKHDEVQLSENITEEAENLKKEPDYRIHGDIITIILKMDEEFIKILQNADAHSQDYVERLKDELRVCSIIDRLKTYLESKANRNVMISNDTQTGTVLLVQAQHLCTAYMCVIEHVYYKYDKTPGQPSVAAMDRLCKYIYAKDSLNRARARASLCHVYHLALHDHYYEARDLMLMCHMQDTINSSDVATQILYNRTVVQLGLCAFRFGAIREAHQALVDMQSGNRAKELLAQGVQMIRNQERTRDQEMKERQRLLPFHMHINLELIECVYLVSAMLIEIPFMASHEYDARKRPISKHFHTQMRQAEKQPVFGPPESMREHVVAASRAMKTGDWSACVNFLINEKMNGKVWNLMPQATEVRKMLTDKIKEESLRTYLFTYATVYDAISMPTLADMFELPVKQVYGIISKMIINEELMASLEEPNQTVIMHHTDPSRTQALSLQLVEKIFQLYEQNEKIVNFRGGEPNFYSRPNQQVQQGQQRNQGTGGGGGGNSGGGGQNWSRPPRSGTNRAY